MSATSLDERAPLLLIAITSSEATNLLKNVAKHSGDVFTSSPNLPRRIEFAIFVARDAPLRFFGGLFAVFLTSSLSPISVFCFSVSAIRKDLSDAMALASGPSFSLRKSSWTGEGSTTSASLMRSLGSRLAALLAPDSDMAEIRAATISLVWVTGVDRPKMLLPPL